VRTTFDKLYYDFPSPTFANDTAAAMFRGRHLPWRKHRHGRAHGAEICEELGGSLCDGGYVDRMVQQATWSVLQADLMSDICFLSFLWHPFFLDFRTRKVYLHEFMSNIAFV
jgi:hypothetical protein